MEGLTADGAPGGILGMLFATMLGQAMCVMRELGRGSVIWVIAVHFLADVILIGRVHEIFL